MSHFDIRSANRPAPDAPMVDIADSVIDYRIDSREADDTARDMLLDSLEILSGMPQSQTDNHVDASMPHVQNNCSDGKQL